MWCGKDDIELRLVFIGTELNIYFFPFALFWYFLDVEAFMLLYVFLKFSTALKLEFIFQIEDFIMNF